MRTNFNMADENITMTKGDTLSFNVILKDQNGNAVSVDSAYFTCRKTFDSNPTFQKSLGSGISQSGGILTVRIAPSDTSGSGVYAGNYMYDFQIGLNGDKFTLMKGVLSIEAEVTTS